MVPLSGGYLRPAQKETPRAEPGTIMAEPVAHSDVRVFAGVGV